MGSLQLAHSSTIPRLDMEHATMAWGVLNERVAAFIEHWETERDPPRLIDFLPESPVTLRKLALIELVKVDLGYQWKWGRDPLCLDHYLEQFPELGGPDGVASALVYEEYQVRKQAGDEVEVEDFIRRFPRQAAEFRRLVSLESPHLTTALFSGQRVKQIEPGERLDDFDLLNQLGKGAFATVFLARQRSMQRLVALKVSADEGTEPQTMAQLDHPHIVRVFDQRQLPEKKLRLLYMQYLPGGTLQEVVEAARRLPPRERTGKLYLAVVDRALEQRGESPPTESIVRLKLAGANWPAIVCWVGARLAAALEYAHRRKVLHRDLKPPNILLTADGSPKLADFNISYSSELEGVTPAAYFGGSLPYMSPEQLAACNPESGFKPDDLDGRSDVYSLGIVLWELLTGQRPFQDGLMDEGWTRTLEDMRERRRAGIVAEELARLPADCPPGLKEVLIKCLAANRDERFQTAGQLARQLELCLQPRVQQLLRPSRGRWRDTVRRFPLLVLALVAFIPNACGSVLNISYNWEAIFKGTDPAIQAAFKNTLLLVVNIAVYSVGISILCALAWPVCREALRRMTSRTGTPTSPSMLRKRCLTLGDLVAGVGFAGWLCSGVAFSVAAHWLSGDTQVDWQRSRELMMSHVVCGLMAATVAFFTVTFVAVRYLYPLLLDAEGETADDPAAIHRLSARVPWYFGSAVISPLLAVIYLAAVDTDIRYALLAVGVLGLATFAVPYRLAAAIKSDLATLVAVGPGGDMGLESTTVDSFWTTAES
jgi:serine/threonine protein kinase